MSCAYVQLIRNGRLSNDKNLASVCSLTKTSLRKSVYIHIKGKTCYNEKKTGAGVSILSYL